MAACINSHIFDVQDVSSINVTVILFVANLYKNHEACT